MNRSITRRVLTVFSLAILSALLCSCSFFAKKAIIKTAGEFGEAVCSGKATDIFMFTEGSDRDFRSAFKERVSFNELSEEKSIYASHMMDSLTVVIDENSVEVKKNDATCDMIFSLADYEALMDGDYEDAEAIGDAIDKSDKKEITVTAEFTKVDKEWRVTNFDSDDFQQLYDFLDYMPPIGRSSLIASAKSVTEAVTSDNADLVLGLLPPASTADPVDMNDYLKDLFDVDGKPTDEEKIFREAVLATMICEVDESSLEIGETDGSLVINMTMADYETLAGKEFKEIEAIPAAVKACGTMNMSFKCEFKREGSSWYAVNLDSEDYAAFLKYKDFYISLKPIAGTYQCTLDITDKFTAFVTSEFGISMPSDLEGRIMVTATAVLENGKYEVSVDRDGMVKNIQTFAETNIDKILMNALGTTSPTGLNAMAKLAGYEDYEDMKKGILAMVSDKVSSVNTSDLESKGTYSANDANIKLTSSTGDIYNGTIDNFGVITVTAKVTDPDAKKLLGSDTITLPFKKVD